MACFWCQAWQHLMVQNPYCAFYRMGAVVGVCLQFEFMIGGEGFLGGLGQLLGPGCEGK